MPRLYKWYIVKMSGAEGKGIRIAYGIVTGHAQLQDAIFIHTSEIEHVEVNGNDVVIQTRNSRYECRMEDADYEAFSDTSLIRDYELFREKYGDRNVKGKEIPHLEENSALLILGNNREYYFDSFYVKYEGEVRSIENAHVHIGMIQDSVLCRESFDKKYVDYDYFPYQNLHVEFYGWDYDLETYIENCGDRDLYVSAIGEVFQIHPSERRHIIPETADKFTEAEVMELSETDLYDIMGNQMYQLQDE